MITCPNCGKQNQDHYKFCLGCGSELPRDQVKAPVHTSTPTPPSGMSAVQPQGGAPAAAPPPAVPAAGAAAPAAEPAPASPAPEAEPAAPAEPLKCPSCEADIPEGFKFCGRCGTPVPDDAKAAPAEAPAAAPAEAAAAEALGRVIMIQPDGSEGASIPITEEGVLIGRTKGEPFSEDYFLSPEHAKFSMSDGVLTAEDENSLNGVYVRLVPEQTYDLSPGDMIRVGQEVVKFELLPEVSKAGDGTELMGSPRKDAWGRLSLVVGKESAGNAFLLEGDEVLVGRERGHIIFPEDGYVSGLHLKITREGDNHRLIDVGSSNGTYLRINGSSQVNSGDYVLMGQYLYRMDF